MTQTAPKPRLFCFGLGYSAQALAKNLLADGWSVAGTCQGEDKRAELEALGITVHLFDRDQRLDDFTAALAGATHLLSSVPPDGDGDAVLDLHGTDIAALENIAWAGYLSTTGVYGDAGGGEVDENSPLKPTSERSVRRVMAEMGWRGLYYEQKFPIHIFRLSGIYGPGRSVLDRVRMDEARRIEKPNHLFGRIHVDDIVGVLRASMAKPDAGAVYNLADDEPSAPGDVIAYACELLGVDPLPAVPFEEAAKEMTTMGLSFWRDNRVVSNRRLKDDLGYTLKYPDYRSGLKSIVDAGG